MASDKESKDSKECCPDKMKFHHKHGGKMGGGFYFLAFVGAAVYFVQNSTTFGMVILGILKAIVWPALVVYKVLGILGL